VSDSGHIPYLDGWRGIAIALVLVAHFIGTAHLIDAGQFGVDIFFVLSGMLISGILFIKRTPLSTFYQRRISRIIPAFYLFTMIVFFVSRHLSLGQGFGFRELGSTLIFLRTYYPGDPHIWNTGYPTGHLWSLNVEEHCYIALSMFAFLPVRSRTKLGVGLCLIGLLCVATNLFYIYRPSVAPIEFQIRTETAGAYVLLSAGYLLLRHHLRNRVRPWMPLAAFVAAAVLYTPYPPKWTIASTPLLLAFAVNHLPETRPIIREFLAWTPLRLLGVWSFSIYLWQEPFYEFRYHFYTPAVALLIAMIVGISSFFFFERPLRIGLNRRFEHKG
jgi:peptidoglycan/LPS O-acetylase OafA/YrhL